MHVYRYKGPVLNFNNKIAESWSGETTALTEAKAKSNLIYQFKNENKLESNTRIFLPGEIILVR